MESRLDQYISISSDNINICLLCMLYYCAYSSRGLLIGMDASEGEESWYEGQCMHTQLDKVTLQGKILCNLFLMCKTF